MFTKNKIINAELILKLLNGKPKNKFVSSDKSSNKKKNNKNNTPRRKK
ncbi:MAG: hypothetical protein IT280_11860 [Ignavibacteria bacterium]|nr:hypothetical protein [Ignavibacteria bacterium]